jgi:hypothetical protein
MRPHRICSAWIFDPISSWARANNGRVMTRMTSVALCMYDTIMSSSRTNARARAISKDHPVRFTNSRGTDRLGWGLVKP